METKQEVKIEADLLNSHFSTHNHSLFSSSSSSISKSLSSTTIGLESDILFDKLINCSTTTTTTTTTTSSVGFMELLGVQQDIFSNIINNNNNNNHPCLFDDTTLLFNQEHDRQHGIDIPYDDEAFISSSLPLVTQTTISPLSSDINNNNNNNNNNNLPTTPNSSSISSASNDDNNNNNDQQLQQQQEEDCDKKQGTKWKKTKEKRPREARVAFMTKSEVDLLEDGYRWRKYGQKAVKHSPFPRSYYRCTSAACNVKKRVERSFSDSSIVVTTYEGHHTHPCTNLPRGMMAVAGYGTGIDAAGCGYMMPVHQMTDNTSFRHQLQMNYINSLVPQLNYVGNIAPHTTMTTITPTTTTSTSCSSLSAQERCGGNAVNGGLITDNGMLQDIVPTLMKKLDH